jgi:hypothetical protein
MERENARSVREQENPSTRLPHIAVLSAAGRGIVLSAKVEAELSQGIHKISKSCAVIAKLRPTTHSSRRALDGYMFPALLLYL